MQRPTVTLSLKEVDALIAQIEAGGGDAEELKKTRAQIADSKWLAKHPQPPGEEEYIEELRKQSTIEHGTDLECMICHGKFDMLISGACENCWRAWMLSTKTRA